MPTKIETFLQTYLKKGLPDVRPGDKVRVYQKIPSPAKVQDGKKEGAEEKTHIFEGLVLARKHGKEMGATITVRREISGIGVERIFPIHSPTIEKIEILSRGRVRRAKLYYLRGTKGKRTKLKRGREFTQAVTKEKSEGKIDETAK